MTGNKTRLSFKQIPSKYLKDVKLYIYKELEKGKAMATLKRYVQGLSFFFKWLVINKYYLHKNILIEYENYLYTLDISIGTKEARWETVQLYLNKQGDNPFKRTAKHRNLNNKYLEKTKINKLDCLFRQTDIPLYIRTIYWILRLIPSRIGEITTLPIDCYIETDDMYILKLHMFKQNGGYKNPQIRKVYLLKDQTSNFLFSLIKEQQAVALKLQQFLDTKDRGCLFTYLHTYYIQNEYREQKPCSRFTSVLNEDSVAAFFRKLPSRYGQDYKVTTHQLRHNAIADRLTFGFTPKQIQTMTAHTTTKMIIANYSHYSDKTTVKLSADLRQENVSFSGKIINDKLEDIILARPNSKRLPNIGICSNCTNCRKEPK